MNVPVATRGADPDRTLPASRPCGELHQVADGVHAYVQPGGGWCVNNAGVVVGEALTLVIDTVATERRARALRSAVDGVSRSPRTLLLNTHHHGDHTFGNSHFPNAVTLAHADLTAEAAEAGLGLTQLWPDVEWGHIDLVPPQLTFVDGVDVYVDGRLVEIRHHGPAHTSNDAVAWLPEDGVLFAGDLVMSSVTPFVMFGSLSGLRRALRQLLDLRPRVVVPGHGPVGGPELIEQNLRYLDRVAAAAAASDDAGPGRTSLEIARQFDLGDFDGWLDPERLVPNLHRALAEEQGLAPAGPLDYPRVFAEMVDFAGGLPTSTA